MKNQKYTVRLNDDERKILQSFILSNSKNNTSQCKVHAKIILCLDKNSKQPLTPEQTAKKCKVHCENVYKIRKQFILEGIERILNRKKREVPPVEPKITGNVEAHIIATACSEPPKGRKAWTLELIAEKVVLEGVLDSLSDTSVRRTLKKHNISLT